MISGYVTRSKARQERILNLGLKYNLSLHVLVGLLSCAPCTCRLIGKLTKKCVLLACLSCRVRAYEKELDAIRAEDDEDFFSACPELNMNNPENAALKNELDRARGGGI